MSELGIDISQHRFKGENREKLQTYLESFGWRTLDAE
jgi:hypothetical protein